MTATRSPAYERLDPRARTTRRLATIALVFIGGPSALLVIVGVLVLVFGSYVRDVVFGILILSFAAVVVIGSITTLFYVRREASLAKLQTDFLSKVSHDLRTPLTSIRMFVETLQMGRGGDPETVQQCLDVIASETNRLTRLIDRLLGWARMEAGKRVYEADYEEVREIVESAVDAFEAQRLEHAYQLAVDLPPALPLVKVDPAAMSEAILNLLQNAHRYTGDDKKISLRARAHAGHVEISVVDNGPGIPQPEHRRIFEKFYRSQAVAKDVPGTGLGLSIVQHIVQAHAGSISVDSQPGKGATFTISLPAYAEPRERKSAAAEAVATPEGT